MKNYLIKDILKDIPPRFWDISIFENKDGSHGMRIYNEDRKINMKFSLDAHVDTIMANVKRYCDLPKSLEEDLADELERIRGKGIFK